MNETLSQTIERLKQAVADYEQFVRTTRSHQLAAQGARESVAASGSPERDSALLVTRAELALSTLED